MTTESSLPVKAIAFDALAIALFALLARIAHNTPEMPLSFVGWLQTMWPFLLGAGLAWVVIVVMMAPTPASPAAMPAGFGFRTGAVVWVLSVAAGLTIWGMVHGAVPHWSFMLVATLMSGLLIMGWRALASFRRR
ncbi:MAG TPA: DUF3054 domain-containing protein [Candidatus Corynebacterium gallistercoris]|uniref:DUF3054 domain-containing protein n=1 Tax=Candidatus Corynebacterium gallistercoris TaxID=2838530 RepID=A0A9D1S048_9CORY|nr:DUF3054 domain-containing protein [Candidatus Corynebacterium gallistercoris]